MLSAKLSIDLVEVGGIVPVIDTVEREAEDGVVGAGVGDLYLRFRRSGFEDVPYITSVHSFRYARPARQRQGRVAVSVKQSMNQKGISKMMTKEIKKIRQ